MMMYFIWNKTYDFKKILAYITANTMGEKKNKKKTILWTWKLLGWLKIHTLYSRKNLPDINHPYNNSTRATTPPTTLHTSEREVVFCSQDQINLEAEKTGRVKQRYWHDRLTFPCLKSFNEIFRIKGELLNVIWRT